jgi:predicted transcriptional regulator of viral defense system
MATQIQQFLRKHPVFTYDAFVQALLSEKERSPNTIKALLAHHIQQGHITRIRRRLFAAIPVGADPKAYPINPYLIAGYATNDAVIAYHSALSFYNLTYSTSYQFIYLTKHRPFSFVFRSENYEGVKFQPSLLNENKQDSFVNIADVQGLSIKVTSLERTIVDVLDKPLLGGGWEEVWRSLAMIERVNIKNVIEYALLLNKTTTISKVGFYLSQRQRQLNVAQEELEKLTPYLPLSPYYIDAQAKKNGKFIAQWNIIVSEELLSRNWEE